MTATDQILRELKLIKERLARMEQANHKKEKEEETWVTANRLRKMYGATFRQLEQLRREELIKYKQVRPGVVRYLLSSYEQLLKKQAS